MSPMDTTSRVAILDSALDLAREGRTTVTLESVAQACGLTKPGVMYHFRNKQSLMVAAVHHLVDRYEQELLVLVPEGPSASAARRMLAYAEWMLTTQHDRSDLVMFGDPRLIDAATEAWSQRLRAWLDIPPSTPADLRVRLHAVRLAAEGSWFADASGILPLEGGDRGDLLWYLRGLIEEAS
jgi:AcrR family transcriptional regulator